MQAERSNRIGMKFLTTRQAMLSVLVECECKRATNGGDGETGIVRGQSVRQICRLNRCTEVSARRNTTRDRSRTFSHRVFTWLSVSCWHSFNCSIHWSSSFSDAFSSIVRVYVRSTGSLRALSTCNKSKTGPSRELNHSVSLEKLLNTNIPIKHTLTKWPIASTGGDVTLDPCVPH